MKNHVILRTISILILPFTFLFGFYVLFHGEVSPGGGFQGGAVWATAVALHALIFSVDRTRKVFRPRFLKTLASAGAIIYVGCGLAMIMADANFLGYSPIGQAIGMMIIEIGVQLTVFGVLSLIFLKLASQDA